MRTRLPKRASALLMGLGMFFLTTQAEAQNLKTSQDDAPQRGHALYKKAKIYDNKTGAVGVRPMNKGDRAMDRWEHDQKMLRNPLTGKIPENISLMESEFSEKIPARSLESEASKKSGETDKRSRFSYWKNRGPGNVGGRTRALALDMRNENIVFAGGVSGGLWRSTNGGETWRKVTKKYQSPSITSIVQDPRPGKRNIWYYASGERIGNSASGGGAFYQGTGIYKSWNNGRSWIRLRNSNDDDVTSFSSFDLIFSLAVHPQSGDLYVATFDGVHRSQDGGRSFEEVLPSGFDSTTEVTITPSGKIYATVSIFGGDNAGFYVSEDGDTWENI
ncbi:MAG: WD40/YVTN/BNR-like repeat-containing protein, partial [Flavobacteriaceae bacterium]